MKLKIFLGFLLLFLIHLPLANAASTAYIANNGSDSLSVLDTATNTITDTIPFASNTYNAAVNPSGTRVYVTNVVDDTVSVLDTSNNSIIDTIAVGAYPAAVTVNPAGTFAYVSNENDASVSVINTATNTVDTTINVGSTPAQIVFNLSGSTAYVCNRGGITVSVIDTASNTVTNTIIVGANPTGAVVHPSGAFLYVVNNGNDNVAVVDTATNAVVTNIIVGDSPQKIAINPTATFLYVTNILDDTVSVLDASNNTNVDTISVGTNPYFIIVSSDGAYAYVTNYGAATLSVIDLSNNTPVLPALAVGNLPQSISPLALDIPQVGLSDSSLSFGNQVVGVTSAVQTVTLSNPGTAPLTITSINASSGYSEEDDCGLSLAPLASCTISVTFTPSSTGLVNGTIQIISDAFTSPNVISLSGTGISRTVVFSPSSLDFPNQRVGGTSSPQEVLITNTGDSTLTLNSISITGDFSQSNDCGASLNSGNSCTVEVSFVPTSGESLSGTLIVESNDPNSPNNLSLSGMGTVTTLELSNTSIVFEPLGAGSAGDQMTTLTNTGTETLTITSISVSRNFSIMHDCNTTMPAGESCDIHISYQSTSDAPTIGSVTILSNADSTPNVISLSVGNPNSTSCALNPQTSASMGFWWNGILALLFVMCFRQYRQKTN